MGDQGILILGDDHVAIDSVGIVLDVLKRFLILPQEFPGLFGRLLLDRVYQLVGCHAVRQTLELLHHLVAHCALAALELGDDLVDLVAYLFLILQHFQAVKELGEAGGRVGHDGLHGIDGLQRIVDAHGIVNLEVRLFDVRAQARGAAHHLFEQHTALDAAHEDQRGDFRHVDTRGQQIHRHGDAGEAFVLETLDGFLHLLLVTAADTARDFHNGVVVHTILSVNLLEDFDDQVGVGVVHGIDKRFTLRFRRLRVDIAGNLLQDDAVEVLIDDLAVEVLHLEVQLVVQELAVGYFARDGVIEDNLVSRVVMDTLFAECCLDDVRSVVVHQIALDHGLAVGVLEHGLSKNLRGLQGRRSGQRNAGRVEVFDDCAVLALVVQLVAVEDFRVAHLLIEDITTVGLIHDDEVVVGDSRHGVVIVIDDTFDHALHGGDLDAGLLVDGLIFQTLDIVYIVQSHQLFQLDLLEHVLRLFTKGVAVNQEEYAAESAGLQEAVNHTQHGAGLARAGRHRQKDVLLSIQNGLFCSLDGLKLIFAQVQTVLVLEQIIGHFLQALIACLDVFFQHLLNASGADPAVQSLGRVVRLAQVKEPNTRLRLVLSQIGSAVGGEGQRDLIFAPCADLILSVLRADAPGILLALEVNDRWDVLVDSLCLYGRHHLLADEQGIVSIAGLAY